LQECSSEDESLLEPAGSSMTAFMALFGRIDSNDEPALDKIAAWLQVTVTIHGRASLMITMEHKKLPIPRQSRKISRPDEA
jgi:hypothetical protein